MPARGNAFILCVDGYESILAGWKMLLESDGYEVLTALDSNSAMALFLSHPVNEVVLDNELRGMSGDLVSRQMKSLKPEVPILMVSGDDPLPEEKLRPVDAFLFKTGSITTFLATIKALLNPRRMMSKNALAILDRKCTQGRAMDVFCSLAQAKAA